MPSTPAQGGEKTYELKRKDVLEDFERFLRVREDLHEKTAQEHAYMAGKFLDYCQEVLPEKERAREFKEKIMNEDYSKSHINNAMKALEYYFSFLGRNLEIKKLKREDGLPDPLSEDEIQRILKSAKNFRDRAILLTLLSTGLRASELCGLNVGDLNFEDRTVRIRRGKGNKERYTIMSEECAEAIERYLDLRPEAESDALFLSRYDERLTRSGLLQLVKRTARRAEIDRNVTVHDFRHTFGTRMIQNGADLAVVKELMRHNDIRTTMVYVHLSQDALREHYDKYYSETGAAD